MGAARLGRKRLTQKVSGWPEASPLDRRVRPNAEKARVNAYRILGN